MRGRTLVAGLLVLILIAGAGWAWWTVADARDKQAKAEMELGLVSGRVLSATFVAARKLQVGTLEGDIVVRSDDKGILTNSQFTRAPATIDYYIDLSNLDVENFRWNEAEQIMSVDLPDVKIARPNIHWEKAQIRQEGVWISRKSGQRLQRQAVIRLDAQARATASRAENIQKAKDNARRAVEDFVRLPLKAAGLRSMRVVVRFPDEAKPRNLPQEDWDRSKPVPQVLAEAADKRAPAR